MSSFNKAILVGRLTRDPEIKYTPQGSQLTKFGLAVDRIRSKNNETDFFNITAWQRLAEVCGQYLKKGKLVLIEGELRTRRYETQDGQKRTSFEVVAQNMQMLGRRNDNKQSSDVQEITVDELEVDEFYAEDMPF